METTLIIIKPDAVQRGLIGRIIARFEDKGLKIVGIKMTQMSESQARTLYEPHRDKPFYPGLIRFMTSSPVVAMAVRGVGAIAICRTMLGATFGSKAEPGSIRGDFGVSNSFNLVHGSDGPESAQRELPVFFRSDELKDYPRSLDGWIYDCSAGTPQ